MPIGTASDFGGDTGSESPVTAGSAPALSSDQIIDQALAASDASDEAQAPADEGAPTTPETDEGNAPEAPAAPAEEPKGEKPDPDERYAEQAVPDNWKAALKAIKALDTPVGKQIQAEHYQLAQYKDALPLEEARELRSLFPTAEEARSARQASADMMALDYSLKNDPQKFIGYIRDYNPQAFGQIAQEFPKWVYDSDPDFYRETISRPAVNINLKHWAEHGDDLQQEAARVLMEANEGFVRGETRADPDEPLRRKVEEYEGRERQFQEQGIASFANDVTRSYAAQLNETINKAIESAGASGLSRDAKNEVAGRVATDLSKIVFSDAYVRNTLQFSAKSGPRDAAHLQKLTEYLLQRARPLIGHKVKEHVTWMTDNIVQANKSRNAKERQVSSQKPVTMGAVSGSQAPREWRAMPESDRKKMSTDDILRAVERGELR